MRLNTIVRFIVFALIIATVYFVVIRDSNSLPKVSRQERPEKGEPRALERLDTPLPSERERRSSRPAGLSGSKPGRSAAANGALPAVKEKKKRNLSPEGRARIAAAVKRRWAAQKKAAK